MASEPDSAFSAGVPSLRVGVGRVAPPLVVLGVVLVVWQAFVIATGVPAVILPAPTEVAVTVVTVLPVLLGDAGVTVATAGLGLAAGIVVGLVLAFVMTYSKSAAAVVNPFVLGLRIAPLVAIAPLLFLWIGHGIPARAALVSTMTVFPVTIASLDGLRTVPREYLDAARSVGAPRWRLFLFIRMPAAAPSVFAGVKLAAALSVTGTIVAEFVTLNAGLGYRVFTSATTLRTPRMFAALAVLAVVGLVFYSVPAALERRVQWEV